MGGIPIIFICLNIWEKKIVKGSGLALGSQDSASPKEKFRSPPKIILSHIKNYLWAKAFQKNLLS
jgi:hypothetical protein